MISEDTSVRVNKTIAGKLKYTKRLLATLREQSVSMEQTIDYALEFTLKNDKELSDADRTLLYSIQRGRLNKL